MEKLNHLSTREGYDRWASNYDSYDNPLIALEEPIVDGLLGPVDGLRIADIGCGTGRYSTRLAAAGGIVTGVDFSTGMLDKLEGKAISGSFQFIEHDLNRGIPLEDEAFDLVISCLVIEHLPDTEGIFKELARICKEGGSIIVTDFHPEMIRRGLHARFRETPDGPKYQIHGAYRPVSGYVMAALKAGLIIEHMSEHIVDQDLVRRSEAAEQWLGEPLLLVFKLKRD